MRRIFCLVAGLVQGGSPTDPFEAVAPPKVDQELTPGEEMKRKHTNPTDRLARIHEQLSGTVSESSAIAAIEEEEYREATLVDEFESAVTHAQNREEMLKLYSEVRRRIRSAQSREAVELILMQAIGALEWA